MPKWETPEQKFMSRSSPLLGIGDYNTRGADGADGGRQTKGWAAESGAVRARRRGRKEHR